VTVVTGAGRFAAPNQLEVTAEDGTRTPIDFRQAIIAAGSEPVALPFLPKDDPRIIDSTGALELSSVPERLLVIGGGIIGLEMGTVFAAFGARVTVVELLDQLIPGADPDLVKPLATRLKGSFENIHLGTKVTAVSETAGASKPASMAPAPRRPTPSIRSSWPSAGDPTAV
jgi:dihydrolipoamide dehydrogenase